MSRALAVVVYAQHVSYATPLSSELYQRATAIDNVTSVELRWEMTGFAKVCPDTGLVAAIAS